MTITATAAHRRPGRRGVGAQEADKTGEPAGSPLLDPDPRKAGVYTAAAEAEALSNRILYDLYGQKLVALHISVTAADRASVHSASCTNAKTGKVPPAASCPPLVHYPAAYRAYLLDTQARVVALGNVIYGTVYDELLAAQVAEPGGDLLHRGRGDDRHGGHQHPGRHRGG